MAIKSYRKNPFFKCNKSNFNYKSLNSKGSSRDYKYFHNIAKENIAVCKKFFKGTFDMTICRLHRTLKAKVMGKDLSGKMKESRRESNEKLVDAVKDHIVMK